MKAILALFTRSVRDDVRSKALLWSRMAIAFTIIFAIFKTKVSGFWGGAPGLEFFSSVIWMNFVFICIAGMSYFASSITEEKEEGTLGLLRMTDLSPFAILLGKGTSRLVGGLMLLLVQLPFALLAITLGGVSLAQVLDCYAILGVFLFFACNVGLLGSVLARSTGMAGAITGAFGGLFLCLPFLVACVSDLLLKLNLLRAAELAGFFDTFALNFCTPYALDEALSTHTAAFNIGGHVVTMLAGGAGAFLLARLAFERFSSEESAVAAGSKGSARGKSRTPTLWPRRARRAPEPSAWADAICWRDFHFIHGGRKVMFIKSCIYTLGAVWLMWSLYGSRSGFFDYSIQRYFWLLFMWASIIAAFESLFATSRIFRLERKNKTFSSLVILPHSLDDIVRSKRRAVLLSLIPVLVFLTIAVVVLTHYFLESNFGMELLWVAQGVMYLIAQIFLNHSLVAWFSLRLKWGGFPLAIGCSWIANMIALSLAVLMFREAFLIILIIAAFAIAFAIRNAFRRQLEMIAAED